MFGTRVRFSAPVVLFSSTHRDKRIISSTPAATSTAGNYNYHGQHIIPPHYVLMKPEDCKFKSHWKRIAVIYFNT